MVMLVFRIEVSSLGKGSATEAADTQLICLPRALPQGIAKGVVIKTGTT